MKKALLSILGIIIFLLGAGYLFLHITYATRDNLSHTGRNMTGFYAENDNTVDVVIIGTSSTFSAYAPMLLWEEYGITSYDLCTNMMFEDAMQFAIYECMKTQSPEVMVIDLASFLFGCTAESFEGNDKVIRYNTDGYKNSINRKHLIDTIVQDENERWQYYFDLMYYHKHGEIKLENWNYSRSNPNKGYNCLVYVYPEGDTTMLRERDSDYRLPDNEIELLNELIKTADEAGCWVIYTIPPYKDSEEDLEEHDRAGFIKKYLEDEGKTVLDLYEVKNQIGIDENTDYSSDYMHYHIFSAQKITRYLGEYLKNKYSLEDHRGDGKYASWHDSLQEWHENQEDYEKRVQKLIDVGAYSEG
ncbi:MAG: hypothetical protein MJ133_01450 [Lachnospiraceae bacterium]|nr:hypothetical protein [Lachnospiraceae bacterium]